MSQAPVDFLNIFVRQPGELIYFFGIISLSLASLFMALGQRLAHPEHLAIRRYTLATGGVVLAWLSLMMGALIALLTDNDALSILPPLERFASVVTLVLITWVFVPSDANRRRTAGLLMGLTLVLVLGGYLVTALGWYDLVGETDFNISVYGATWTFIATLLSIAGLLLVLLNFATVSDAPLKMVFFTLLLIGHGATLLQIAQGNIIGDYAGPIRLVFIVSLAIVPALIYRDIIHYLEHRPAPTKAVARPIVPDGTSAVLTISPIERESIQLMRALGMILDGATAKSVPHQVVEAVLEVMKADVVALLRLQDANYADIVYAYDRPLQRDISGVAINLDNQPTLVNSIERQTQHTLLPEQNADELNDLYTRMDIEQIGPVYLQPLSRDKQLVGVLVVALPYAKREFLKAEQELLKGISVISSGLLALSYAATDAQALAEERAIQAVVQGVPLDEIGDSVALAARARVQNDLREAYAQIGELSRQVEHLKGTLESEQKRLSRELGDTEMGASISQQMLAISDTQKLIRTERDTLADRVKEAEAALRGVLSADDERSLREMVASLQHEKELLEQERAMLQTQLDDLRADDRLVMPANMQSVLNSMLREQERLESERNELRTRLTDIQTQLNAAGIADGSIGLAQIINQLVERSNLLQAQNTALIQQLEQSPRGVIAQPEPEQVEMLQKQLRNIAGDREVALKQRDKLRAERDDLQQNLDKVKEHRTRLMAQSAQFEMELQEAHERESGIRQQMQQMMEERSELMNERDRLLAELEQVSTERDQLMARIEGDRDRVQEVSNSGIGSLTTMIKDLTVQRRQLEHEINALKTRLADQENELDALRLRLESGESAAQYQPNNPDLLVNLVEDLRTPMTSIVGYVDLLLSESAGILGAMQRMFLQRVSTNVTRLSTMMDDLVRLTALDTGNFALERTLINITSIVETAISNASTQFREKHLPINLNLDDRMPLVPGDADAIGQVVAQLLTNAYLVSPSNSEVRVTSRVQDGKAMVIVEDRGGGIAAEDLSRVFARKYKADHPLIQGVGDTGVGLAVARALVEAHGGSLWVESIDNLGSQFIFTLPLQETQHAS
ncbi:MAG: hypothetical protein OHK0046_07040 [Anaerolineae bacterium]